MSTITQSEYEASLTDHQRNWRGIRPCLACNPQEWHNGDEQCRDCKGLGFVEWAALAWEPWSEIVPNLWVGAHDYAVGRDESGRLIVASKAPDKSFKVVISLYSRTDCAPDVSSQHFRYRLRDADLSNPGELKSAQQAADRAYAAVSRGDKTLVRCQAGLNRSGLVAALALQQLGYSAQESVDLLRSKRSPWALCNTNFENFLLKGLTS